MKQIIIIILSISISVLCDAQKHDNVWVFGDIGNDSPKGSIVDFSSGHPVSKGFDIQCTINSNASFSNAEGTLVAYTDGCRIYNRNHEIMKNGDGINAGEDWNRRCDLSDPYYDGYWAIQSFIFLPFPGDSSKSVFFHLKHSEYGAGNEFTLSNLYDEFLEYSVINLDGDNGKGEVIEKNIELNLTSDLMSRISAVKHANGRDWWILVFRRKINKYYSFLLTPNGVTGPFEQFVGVDLIYPSNLGQSSFSPDGTKFSRISALNHIEVLDFDRCNGLLSNAIWLKWPFNPFTERDSYPPVPGVAFSPNSRFLYVSYDSYVFQYDLWSDDIDASRVQICEKNAYYSQMTLGPDDKIYVFSRFGLPTNAVIEFPNLKGVDCSFNPEGLILTNFHNATSPNFPNYRLGALENSPCDTIR